MTKQTTLEKEIKALIREKGFYPNSDQFGLRERNIYASDLQKLASKLGETHVLISRELLQDLLFIAENPGFAQFADKKLKSVIIKDVGSLLLSNSEEPQDDS